MQGAESIDQNQPGSCKYFPFKVYSINANMIFGYSTVSNPPPSPVGQEQSSPEYKTHEININLVDSTDLPSTSKAALTSGHKQLISYDDDILDVNCGEMDLF